MSDETPRDQTPRAPHGGQRPSPQELEQARRDALRLKMTRRKLGLSGRIGRAFLESKLTPLIIVASLLLGAFAIMVTPSEEEPQIKVPMIDVFLGMPGATAQEVETEVSDKIEQAVQQLGQLKEVESKSDRGMSTVTVRQPREKR